VSADFIKGVYTILYDITEDVALYDRIITMDTNMELNGCMSEDILGWWADGNRFIECWLPGSGYESNEDKPSLTVEKYNAEWNRYIYNNPDEDEKIAIPSKRFVAFIQVNATNYIIQFDSIDFLNGYETLHGWARNIRGSYISHYLDNVFDSGEVCHKIVTYGIPCEEESKIKNIIACIDVYLPNVLTQLISRYAMQCRKSKSDHTQFNTIQCNTLCLRDKCHVHCNEKKLDLKDCLATVTLCKLMM
jgi:hypothetical protein